jgi:hypothetical protein
VLLMTRTLFDGFAGDLLRTSGVHYAVHHSECVLRTS